MTMDDALPSYTPQAITDILPIYCAAHSDSHILTYSLHQTSPATQSLTLTSDHEIGHSAYNIKSRATGGFMNKKPHVVISDLHAGRSKFIAEGRFGIHGTGTTIIYGHRAGEGGPQQELELQDSLAQLLKTRVGGNICWWQPHPGNKGVWELTNEYDEVIARFIHKEDQDILQRHDTPPQDTSRPERRGSILANNKSVKKTKDGQDVQIGELQVADELVGGEGREREEVREEVVCSAIMVIERARRRRANLSKSGPALRGPASWGWDGAPAGGFR